MTDLKPKCRFCNSASEHQSIKGNYVFGGTDAHKFWHCAECDLVYLFPVISEEEEERFYAQEFEKFMSSRAGTERDWTGPEKHIATNQDQVIRRWKYLAPHIKPGMDLLEIGCSSGFMMNAFRDAGARCVGIEPSGNFLEFLQKNGHLAYRGVDEFKKAKPGQKFDLITHFFVFEHIREPISFLQSQMEMLKPGGKIIFEIPCVTDPLVSIYDIPAFHKFYWSIAHHYYFSPKSLSHILNKMGCKYELLPDQRYDMSNHMVWMQYGKPGGQGRYSNVFSPKVIEQYKEDLKQKWLCDTIVGIISKE